MHGSPIEKVDFSHRILIGAPKKGPFYVLSFSMSKARPFPSSCHHILFFFGLLNFLYLRLNLNSISAKRSCYEGVDYWKKDLHILTSEDRVTQEKNGWGEEGWDNALARIKEAHGVVFKTFSENLDFSTDSFLSFFRYDRSTNRLTSNLNDPLPINV